MPAAAHLQVLDAAPAYGAIVLRWQEKTSVHCGAVLEWRATASVRENAPLEWKFRAVLARKELREWFLGQKWRATASVREKLGSFGLFCSAEPHTETLARHETLIFLLGRTFSSRNAEIKHVGICAPKDRHGPYAPKLAIDLTQTCHRPYAPKVCHWPCSPRVSHAPHAPNDCHGPYAPRVTIGIVSSARERKRSRSGHSERG